MKTEKIKRYRLSVSRTFPETHLRSGEKTYFIDYIKNVLPEFSDEAACYDNGNVILNKKYHTIRGNYKLWESLMLSVRAGLAVIELFYWTDKPYRSKQIVFATLDKDSGCGVQMVRFKEDMLCAELNSDYIYRHVVGIEIIAKNDCLSVEDFKSWFKVYDLTKPMAIIHFTKFRY